MAFFVVTKEQFEQITSVDKYDIVTGQRKKMKERIMDVVKGLVKVNWFRLRKVSAVMDEIIYMLTDRGFSFNGRETLAKKCGVSLATVDRAIRLLKDSGLFYVAYRENTRSNSVKTPIFFYKNHELFSEYAAILNIENDNEADKDENITIPCESKVEPTKKEATYIQPTPFNDLNKRIDDLDYTFTSDSVPQNFVQAVRPFFDDAKKIEEYWKMVKISNHHANYEPETLIPLAVHAFKQMIGKLKRGHARNPFAYFYGILQKKLDELYFADMQGFFGD